MFVKNNGDKGNGVINNGVIKKDIKNNGITFLFKVFHRPLTVLSVTALLVVSSSRFAFALIAAVNLAVVSVLAVLIAGSLKKLTFPLQSGGNIALFPQENRSFIYVFLSSFVGCVFFFVYYCVMPLLAMETLFITLFVPIFAYSENIPEKYAAMPLLLAVKKCFFENLSFGVLIMAVALIREPLGYATLSLPGGSSGIIELFNKEGRFPFTIEIAALSSGAFLLIGFIMVLFRILERRKTERRRTGEEWPEMDRRGSDRRKTKQEWRRT
jgi:Na+-transporting NADH:ubiquinone oxidoreductase subunit NqrD